MAAERPGVTVSPTRADHDPPAAGTVRAVVFDCYGTLIDFDERAFAPAVDAFLRRVGVQHVDGAELWRHWMESARDYAREHGRDPERPLEGPEPPFFPFADLWPRHFARAFRETGVSCFAWSKAAAPIAAISEDGKSLS